MTKKELVESLKEYPDSAEIEMQFERIDQEGTETCPLNRVYDYETVIGTKIALADY